MMKDKEHSLDQQIKNLFAEHVSEVTMDNALREKLLAQQRSELTMSPVQRFLEREVTISLTTVTVVAGAMVLVVGLLLQTLFLPGDVPTPKYKIIEMQALQSDVSQLEWL
ncbi:MAG: hypothetical protein NUK65_00745 [Firmicutes bacterium]|nr:hypothetical protein [Bacillota bacterium]